ncbi:hypothetical protein PAPHI01_2098 [Pancytospora philotis]|nr:hypothetical protein PAPHI01_2098 [Pancytospora philotis]
MLILSLVNKLVLIALHAGAAVASDIPGAVRQTRNGGRSVGASAAARAEEIEETFDSDSEEYNVDESAAAHSNDTEPILQGSNMELYGGKRPDDMNVVLKTGDQKYSMDVNRSHCKSKKLCNSMRRFKALPEKGKFNACAQSALKKKGNYISEVMEIRGPKLERIVSHIYEAAVELNATRLDLVSVTALAIHYYYFTSEKGDAEEKVHRDSRARGFLGVYRDNGLRGRTRMHRHDPSRPFIDRKLRDAFSLLSIRVEFKVYMELLKPTADPITFWSVLTNIYMNGNALLKVNGVVNEDLVENIVSKLQTFNTLSEFVVDLPAAPEFADQSDDSAGSLYGDQEEYAA